MPDATELELTAQELRDIDPETVLNTEFHRGRAVLVVTPERIKAVVTRLFNSGYGFLATEHEGKEVAEWLNSLGVAGVVLKYRLAPKYKHPAPLDDARRARSSKSFSARVSSSFRVRSSPSARCTTCSASCSTATRTCGES